MFQREPFTSCPVTGTSEKFGSIAFCPHQVQDPEPSPPQAGRGWFHPGGVTASCCHPGSFARNTMLVFMVSSSPPRMPSGSILHVRCRACTPYPALFCSSLASCVLRLCVHLVLFLVLPVTPCSPSPAPIPTSLPTQGTLLTAVGCPVPPGAAAPALPCPARVSARQRGLGAEAVQPPLPPRWQRVRGCPTAAMGGQPVLCAQSRSTQRENSKRTANGTRSASLPDRTETVCSVSVTPGQFCVPACGLVYGQL